jgi:hypothetical protein
MAKKPRSGRPQPGGRVTPKGVRPPGTTTHDGHGTNGTDRPTAPLQQGPVHGRGGNVAPHVPTRAGHHRGNR